MCSRESITSCFFVVVAVAVFWLLAACTSSPLLTLPVSPHQVEGGVEFSLVHSGAQSVAVVGDFNDWSRSSHLLARKDGDRWSGVVPLSSGEHVFMFVVNGEQWVVPPVADDYVEDGFGQKNGVVVVR
ncbi:MAG: isoamylase early set domain-containing protein [Nitrospirota bacterium]|nr:isoamylase early set domain-containing protein [Nitrospirota bacterium]MDH5699235.1 isoamylase early set domain-containing protein [Nitrospirota bacterium]